MSQNNNFNLDSIHYQIRQQEKELKSVKQGSLRMSLDDQINQHQFFKSNEQQQRVIQEASEVVDDQNKFIDQRQRQIQNKQNIRNDLANHYQSSMVNHLNQHNQDKAQHVENGRMMIERAQQSLLDEKQQQKMKKEEYRLMAEQQYYESQQRKEYEKDLKKRDRMESSRVGESRNQDNNDFYTNPRSQQNSNQQPYQRVNHQSKKDEIDQLIEKGIQDKLIKDQLEEEISRQQRLMKAGALRDHLNRQIMEKDQLKYQAKEANNRNRIEILDKQSLYNEEIKNNHQRQKEDKRNYLDTLQKMQEEHYQTIKTPQTSISRKSQPMEELDQQFSNQHNPLTNPHPYNIQNPYIIKSLGASGQSTLVLQSSKSKFASIARSNIFTPINQEVI